MRFDLGTGNAVLLVKDTTTFKESLIQLSVRVYDLHEFLGGDRGRMG